VPRKVRCHKRAVGFFASKGWSVESHVPQRQRDVGHPARSGHRQRRATARHSDKTTGLRFRCNHRFGVAHHSRWTLPEHPGIFRFPPQRTCTDCCPVRRASTAHWSRCHSGRRGICNELESTARRFLQALTIQRYYVIRDSAAERKHKNDTARFMVTPKYGYRTSFKLRLLQLVGEWLSDKNILCHVQIRVGNDAHPGQFDLRVCVE